MGPIDKKRDISSRPTPSVSARRDDPKAVVEEYFYLLEGVPAIDETPEDLHETVCSLLGVLTTAHAMSVLYHLFCEQRPLRFNELEDATGASPKVLSQRLKEFVEAGLVTRQSYDTNPPHVEYAPTAMAKDLDPAFQFLYAWAAHHD